MREQKKRRLEALRARRTRQNAASDPPVAEPPLRGRPLYDSASSSQAEEDNSLSDAEDRRNAIRQSLRDELDDYDDDFVVDDDDETIGAPLGLEDIPLQFTRLAHKKPKAHFKDVIEWMVHKKLNPAFPRDDPIYHIAFQKIDDEARGYSGSKFISSVWTGDFATALKARPAITEVPVPTMFETKCDACNRSGHPASFRITFQGKAYNSETLENLSDNEDSDSDDEDEEGEKGSRDANGHILPSADKEYFVGK